MSDQHPIVTVHDPVTGEDESNPLPPHEYMVITGSRREVSSVQVFGNGTVQMTIKLLGAES